MNPSSQQDEWLMQQVARGGREHLEVLVRRYASRLLTFLQWMSGDAHTADEMFQEVFLAVWLKRGTYRYPRPFKNWLYAIAANKCKAHKRSRRPTVALSVVGEDCGDEDDRGSPVDTAIATEHAQLVSRAVTELPPQQRTVVVLRMWENLPYGEIAEIVGRNEGTVRSHMHHALAALRRQLAPALRKSEE